MTDKLEPVSPLALPANRKPARTTKHALIEDHLDEQTAEIKDALALPDEQETRPALLRRRTQDEMLRALHILTSDRPRARDDESPQVLEDAVYEVAALRQVVGDLMQAASSMYQSGMASIRKMTER